METNVSPSHRAFLDWINVKWYVETLPDKNGYVQSGNVVGIQRDRHGVPVCLKVESGSGGYNYISADSVVFFEPYDEFVGDCTDYYQGFCDEQEFGEEW